MLAKEKAESFYKKKENEFWQKKALIEN
jgi:hypothetical protein